MIQDLRLALRQFTRFPGYAAVVVLTLALGIAVNTVIFGTVSAMFLQPLPVRDPEKLVVISERSDQLNLPIGLSYLDYLDIRAGSRSLTHLVADFISPAHVGAPGHKPARGWIEVMTPAAFEQLGIPVALGRPLQAADGELPPGAPVAVLNHGFWQSRFGGDPDVVGRAVLVNGHSLTIVGVAGPEFHSLVSTMEMDLYVPSGTYAQLRSDGDGLFKYRGAKAWRIFGHRAEGASLADVNADLAVFAQRFNQEYPQDHRHSRFRAVPEPRARPDPSVAELMPALIALFTGMCALVLLIACANVANLMGARALEREKELVVRSALGASRGTLIRQLLVESLLLAMLAGAVGYLLAAWGSELLSQSIPTGDVPVRRTPSAGWQLGVFTVGVSLVSGLLAGLVPARRASRINLVEGLKQGAGRQSAPGRHRGRDLLVVGQVAISCVVLLGAALLLRGLQAAGSLDLGFRPEHTVMLSFDLGMQGYDEERGLRFMDQAVEQVRALPGVEAAAFSSHVPFTYAINLREVWPEHPPETLPDGHASIAFTAATSAYLATLGTPVIGGRDFTTADSATAPRVAIINEAMAKAFWPGRDPLGQHFRIDGDGAPPIEVVGLTRTGKYVMLSEETRPYFYVPQAQRYSPTVNLVVRTRQAPAGIVSSLRQVLQGLDPDLPVSAPVSLDEHLGTSVFALMPLRTGAKIAVAQGLIALGLAVMGLYAVVAAGVTRRTREIGIRMALGASRGRVLRMISREALRLTLTGVALGLALSVVLAAGLSRVIYGVRTFDPLAYLAVVVLLVSIAALACWLPARRATQVDPMVALRAE